MQTFLPYPSFVESAQCLDYRRLGKQRVECKQILQAITRGSGAWSNHPATNMWRGYENALCHYMNTIIKEWWNRGYVNNMFYCCVNTKEITYPPWLGNEKFHAAHRSNLLRKDPVFYGAYNWKEPTDLEYVWPL